MTTRVYRYGALRPGKDIRDQMWQGHRYYNRLCEAENNRRVALWGGNLPPLPPHPDQTPSCTCKDCRKHWSDLRIRMRTAPLLDVKPLRAAAVKGGLYFGTYLLIEQSFAAACKKTSHFRRVSFHSHRQGMIAGVQVQLPYRKRNTTHMIYRVAKAPDSRTGRRRGQRATVQIRIGSDEKRRPIFCEPIRIEQHRPLTGSPTWIQVVLKYVADREVWSVNFVCADVADQGGADQGVVAVDVSWRKLPDGTLRIAYAIDDQGKKMQFCMSERWMELARRADRIRSIRDRHLIDLQRTDSRFGRLKSPRSVARVVYDQNITEDRIVAWTKRERHLWQYEAGCRRRSVAARRSQTREWIRDLRNHYSHVVIKNSKHKMMKEKKDLPRPARRQGHHAAPGEVIEEICRSFGREEGVTIVSALHTTNTCSCGHVNDHGPELDLQCERCGDVTDRDIVSTRNMLALYAAGATAKPTARKKGARFAKRHKSGEKGRNASSAA